MNSIDHFISLPAPPLESSSPAVLRRFIETIGFRYKWATESFTENEINFCPVEGSMNMMELINHIYDIVTIINRRFFGEKPIQPRPESFNDIRNKTIEYCLIISSKFKELSEDDFQKMESETRSKYSFWYFINGPISDALTHIGQITSWRRISGNPQPKGINLFEGTYTQPES